MTSGCWRAPWCFKCLWKKICVCWQSRDSTYHLLVIKQKMQRAWAFENLRIFQTVWWTMHMWRRKIFQAVLCPTHLFQENWFALSTNTVLATKFPTNFNPTLLRFLKNSSKMCGIDATFSKMCRTFKTRLSAYRPIYTCLSSVGHNRGK